MPTCKEIARAVASDELATWSWRQRLALRLHLLICRHCRRYVSQIRALGEAARQLFRAGSEETESLDRLQASLLDNPSADHRPGPARTD